MKTKIGIWLKRYGVFLNKEKDRIFWTIEDKDGKEKNRFDSKEDFGHWMFHSGWVPGEKKKNMKFVLRKE